MRPQAEYVLAMTLGGLYAHLAPAEANASMERDFRQADHSGNGFLEARRAHGSPASLACSTR
jgi:hypothetical protein